MATTSPPVTPPDARGRLPLTPGRVIALVIGVPVCLALVANTGFSLLAPFAGGSYPVNYPAPASTRSLTVDSSGGQLSVKPATGDRVTLAGTARYSFIKSTLTEHTAGGDTTVSYHCVPLPSGNCALDATALVPAGLPVVASTDGGNASVSGVSAPVTLSTGGGELSADHVSGPLTLSTDGGNITASDITGPSLRASSGGGGIQASAVDSPAVTISTAGGNIRATGVTAGTVAASTGGGGIYLVFASVPASVRVNTSGGDITLVLPPGQAKYRVYAHTDSGSSSDGLAQSSSSANSITATSGGGTIILRYS
jgi:hypothetical protein